MDEAQELNCHGFICGPSENMKFFFQRINFVKTFPDRYKDLLEQEKLKTFIITDKVMDIDVDWALIRPNSKIPFWEKGRTWTFSVDEMEGSFIEIQKLSEYEDLNVKTHEMVHLIRQAFHEPRFEEILAFYQDNQRWRRFWGPLFKTSKEVNLFMCFFALSSILSLCGLCIDYFFIIDFLIIWFLVARLFVDQYVFKCALRKIEKVFETENPYKIALRLTDEEILFFAKKNKNLCLEKISSNVCFRWKQIREAYFKKNGLDSL